MTATDIKTARKTLGLTQAGLAERIGMSVDTIRAWEQNARPVSKIASTFITAIVKQHIQDTDVNYIDELANKNSFCRKVSYEKTAECPIYDPDEDNWKESDNDFRNRIQEVT